MTEEMFYRRDGSPYPPGEEGIAAWCADLSNMELRIVRQDQLADGTYISTVWIGVDMDHWSILTNRAHAPLIFETMMWDVAHREIEQRRWATENDAIAGHCEMRDKWAAHTHN